MGRGPLGHRPWSGPRAAGPRAAGPRAVNWAAGRGPAFSKTPFLVSWICFHYIILETFVRLPISEVRFVPKDTTLR